MSVRGLHKIIYPFAPDQSGAVSVLYELGGMIIICDAGGCAGNVCGFDEPRWLDTRSAVFSAGLRDMDAILGRDDLLIKKITGAAKRLDADFSGAGYFAINSRNRKTSLVVVLCFSFSLYYFGIKKGDESGVVFVAHVFADNDNALIVTELRRRHSGR